MWGKLDDAFRMTCLKCNYTFNPYAQCLNLIGTIQGVFYIFSQKNAPNAMGLIGHTISNKRVQGIAPYRSQPLTLNVKS